MPPNEGGRAALTIAPNQLRITQKRRERIAALTAISATANVNARDQASFQARTDARNALEVFRYASNADDFRKNMTFQFKPETPSADKTTYTVDYGWCTLTVTADFVQSRFTARAVNNKGDVLFEVNNYEK